MSEALYLKNGNFIDVVNGRSFGVDVGVVIQDGKITAMPGLPGEPEAPVGSRAIDLLGRTVIPGLFNTHTHLQLVSGLIGHDEVCRRQMEKNMADCLEYGITNIRDAWAPNLSVNRALTGRVDAGEIPGPRVQQCVVVCPEGNWCAPKPTAFNNMFLPLVSYDKPASGVVAVRPDASEREIRDAVNRAVDERGADCIKLYDQDMKFITYKPGAPMLTDGQTAVAVDQAVMRDVPVTAHHTKAWLFRRHIACGTHSLAHLPSDEKLSEEDVKAFLASGCFIEPTLSVSYGMAWSSLCQDGQVDGDMAALEAYREKTFADMASKFWLPELADIYRKNFANYSKGNFRFLGLFDMSTPMRMHTRSAYRGYNFRLLFKSGGKERIACGNDATVAFYTQAAIGIELALMKLYLEREGIRAEAADLLRIATIQSARAMRLEGLYGSIETGKTADLVVLEGNPLADTGLIGSKAAAVFKGGRLVVDNCGLNKETF